jgi:hypothetical protein
MSRLSSAALVVLLALPGSTSAQQPSIRPDSARAQIQSTLRAFYFNLAHQDWEALTADILAAKVVAHRSVPEGLVTNPKPLLLAGGSWARGDEPAPCSSGSTAPVDQVSVSLDHDWARASVPRCEAGRVGADEFRLIHFEGRWRLVYIELFQTR